MPLSIGVNLRVTGHCNQGGRKYMEDMFSVAYHLTPDDKDLEYAFFGIFDGHGGGEAATFAKEYLMDIIVKQKSFWSDRDEDVLRAIKDGFLNTHYAMWRELDKWPRTASGLPSTAGTTASIAFIRKGKVYIGHVGDSGIILGHQVDGDPQWRAKALTKDHKPESGPEMIRIQESGGKVVSKSGVPRVVWNRPRIGHKGPVRRSTHIDEIPFLAVARSLGDLWSYNSELNTFVVSPEPDVKVVAVDVKSHRCLIFGTDGLWNMLTPQAAVAIVQAADRHNEKHLIASQQTGNGPADGQMWINPSKSLVDRALERWSSTRLRADNTSVVTVMLDPPGPSRSEVLLSQKKERVLSPKGVVHHGTHASTAILPEPIEKPSSNTVNPVVPRPPPIANLDIVDPKQPDSSNQTVGSVSEVSTCESTPLDKTPLKETDVCQDSEDTELDKPEQDALVPESIQVAEVSSSEISEDTGETEAKETTVVNDTRETEGAGGGDAERTETVETDKAEKGCGVQILVPPSPRPEEAPSPDVETDASNVRNAIRQFPNAREELKAPIYLANRLRRSAGISSGSAALGSTELRNNILNGSRHKQHALFPNARGDIRSLKRRHSLSSQNGPAESGPSNAGTYANVNVNVNLNVNVNVNVNMNSRFKSHGEKGASVEEAGKSGAISRPSGGGIGTKRRHSAIHQSAATGSVEDSCAVQEPCLKRRTRSEDRPSPADENVPANQTIGEANSRLGWPTNESSVPRSGAGGPASAAAVQERLSSPNGFQRKSLGKKATPVKAIRRPSFNGASRLQQLRGSFGFRDWDQTRNGGRSAGCNDRRINRSVGVIGSTDSNAPQRWLRSDTMAATPVKTLRSRNVDITGHTISAQLVHQYGVVKPNRLSLPSKLKQSAGGNGTLQSSRLKPSALSSGKLKQANGAVGGGGGGGGGASGGASMGGCSGIGANGTGSTGSASAMAKRVKSPYNPSARSLSTRSRIKRLGK